MNSALDKSKAFKGTVYRGIGNMPDDVFDAIASQKTIRWQSFASSSKSSGVASDFMSSHAPGGILGEGKAIMFEIKTVSGVDLHAVSLPKYYFEKEVLLRTGTAYRVTSTEQLGTGTLKMYLEEITKEVVK